MDKSFQFDTVRHISSYQKIGGIFNRKTACKINYYFLLLHYTGQGKAFGHNPDR
jgi:hypothetical protein